MKVMEYDGNVANILAHRTLFNTPATTVWHFIADNGKTIGVTPYPILAKPAGEAHEVPVAVKSLLAYSPLGEALAFVASSMGNDWERTSGLASIHSGYPGFLAKKEVLRSRVEMYASPSKMLSHESYGHVLRAMEPIKGKEIDLIEYAYNSLPEPILELVRSAVEQIQSQLKYTPTWAWNEFKREVPYLAFFKKDRCYALVKQIQVFPHDVHDVEALKNLGLWTPLSLATPATTRAQAIPVQAKDRVPNLQDESTTTNSRGENTGRTLRTYKGKENVKPADVYEMLGINRYDLDQLIALGKLRPVDNPASASNQRKKGMRLFRASDVLAIREGNEKGA